MSNPLSDFEVQKIFCPLLDKIDYWYERLAKEIISTHSPKELFIAGELLIQFKTLMESPFCRLLSEDNLKSILCRLERIGSIRTGDNEADNVLRQICKETVAPSIKFLKKRRKR